MAQNLAGFPRHQMLESPLQVLPFPLVGLVSLSPSVPKLDGWPSEGQLTLESKNAAQPLEEAYLWILLQRC